MSKKPQRPRPIRMATNRLRLPAVGPNYGATHISKLASIVARDGIMASILVDENGIIRSGMALYLAAQVLGLSEVPVVKLDCRRAGRGRFRGGAL